MLSLGILEPTRPPALWQRVGQNKLVRVLESDPYSLAWIILPLATLEFSPQLNRRQPGSRNGRA